MTDYTAIKAQLTERLKELSSRIDGINEDLRETPDEDWEDHATESENDEVLMSVGQVTFQEIDQINEAIRKIDAGTYGVCEDCGKRIRRERLNAMPFATRCTPCAEAS